MITNILIIEDCSVMRMMIKRTLNLSNMENGTIYEASNGMEGLEILNRKSVDLVILDMYMPVMDGMEVIDKVKARSETRDVPILIVSTESNEKRVESLVNLASGFVHKPFTPEDLKAEILKIASETETMGIKRHNDCMPNKYGCP